MSLEKVNSVGNGSNKVVLCVMLRVCGLLLLCFRSSVVGSYEDANDGERTMPSIVCNETSPMDATDGRNKGAQRTV